jgi:DtxR family transcriptional regulator, Mn-dependent transcriptional regulator
MKGMLSYTEENYLKTIYHLSDGGQKAVTTNDIAASISTKAATVTDMIKKLSAKQVIAYEKYYGVNTTKKGKALALIIVRKHRLWETFLVEKLGFQWDEVHEVAEQLEHIQSSLLIEKLDAFLGFPASDPHGHPIPDKNGKIISGKQIMLTETEIQKMYTICAVKKGSPSFLQYLKKIGLQIGAPVKVIEKIEFDGSLELSIQDKQIQLISREAAKNILVKE